LPTAASRVCLAPIGREPWTNSKPSNTADSGAGASRTGVPSVTFLRLGP
jgi:hypothetical protein